jgi:hypothetical protein
MAMLTIFVRKNYVTDHAQKVSVSKGKVVPVLN